MALPFFGLKKIPEFIVINDNCKLQLFITTGDDHKSSLMTYKYDL